MLRRLAELDRVDGARPPRRPRTPRRERWRSILAVVGVVALLAAIEEASGFTLTVEGETTERPQENRPLVLEQYGVGWAPSLVAWSDPEESPELGGRVLGYAGSGYVRQRGRVSYVSGSVTLDAPQLSELIASGRSDQARGTLLHEVTHLLGLAHVTDQDELMYPLSDATELASGDRAGLAALGTAGCADA